MMSGLMVALQVNSMFYGTGGCIKNLLFGNPYDIDYQNKKKEINLGLIEHAKWWLNNYNEKTYPKHNDFLTKINKDIDKIQSINSIYNHNVKPNQNKQEAKGLFNLYLQEKEECLTKCRNNKIIILQDHHDGRITQDTYSKYYKNQAIVVATLTNNESDIINNMQDKEFLNRLSTEKEKLKAQKKITSDYLALLNQEKIRHNNFLKQPEIIELQQEAEAEKERLERPEKQKAKEEQEKQNEIATLNERNTFYDKSSLHERFTREKSILARLRSFFGWR